MRYRYPRENEKILKTARVRNIFIDIRGPGLEHIEVGIVMVLNVTLVNICRDNFNLHI